MRAGAVACGLLVLATAVSAGLAVSRTQMARARRRFAGPVGLRITKLSAPGWFASRLSDVDGPWPADAAWSMWLLITLVAVGVGVVVGGIGLALVVVVVAMAAPALSWSAWRHRADDRLEAAVPGALDEIARGLRSGGSLSQALAEAAATSPPAIRPHLSAVSSAAERGLGLVAALEGWAERRPLPSVRLSVAALCLGAETGGAQARAIDGVAATVRQRLAVVGEAKALATQARLSGVVIAAAPVGFCALASLSDPRVGRLLLQTPVGWLLLVLGLSLDGIGAAWMARLARPRL